MKRIRIEGLDFLQIKILAITLLFTAISLLFYGLASCAGSSLAAKIFRILALTFFAMFAFILSVILYRFDRIRIFVIEEKSDRNLELKEIK
jgi:hypothetical protein